ncbi:hypothetical protein [Sporosarcina aquimarina]|uniref:Uncharacterized protein n=1 Tax=Sporosarcina aquimarina TaxID=114975 RepID=A0ABU4G1Y2_9BACL|nr:hypothetical protein [Sporosarcina aquimarina]MDW0110380.1 hypothetical protein [Sporosarcina aquimarina]
MIQEGAARFSPDRRQLAVVEVSTVVKPRVYYTCAIAGRQIIHLSAFFIASLPEGAEC